MTPASKSALPKRRNPRLPGYDYGQIVQQEWPRTGEIRREVRLDEFVVMPNHLHGIVFIDAVVPATRRAHGRAPLRRGPRSLGSLIAGFKSAVTKRINIGRGTPRFPVWQRNYYEHVIRDENDLTRVCEYIGNNPLKWALDENNPANLNRPVGAPTRRGAPAGPRHANA